jgi:hypothetical protein
MVKPLHEHTFQAVRTDNGHYTGRCPEWPDLHTRTHRRALDAVDEIVDQVAAKLRRIHATTPIAGAKKPTEEATT